MTAIIPEIELSRVRETLRDWPDCAVACGDVEASLLHPLYYIMATHLEQPDCEYDDAPRELAVYTHDQTGWEPGRWAVFPVRRDVLEDFLGMEPYDGAEDDLEKWREREANVLVMRHRGKDEFFVYGLKL